MRATAVAPALGRRELGTLAIATALPVAAAAALSPWVRSPLVVVAAVAAIVAAVLAVRRALRYSAHAVWVAVLALSIGAGELSAVSFGGQNGRLLWADGVLGIGVLLWLVRGRHVHVPAAPFLVRLVPFLAWASVGLLVAPDVLTGVAELKEWMAATAIGVVAAVYASDRGRARALLAAVALTGAMIGLHMLFVDLTSPYGPVLAVLMKKVDLPWGRTNYLAGLMILTFPIALGLLASAATLRERLVWVATLVLTATGIVLSASKGGILSLALAFLIAFARGGRAARAGLGVMVAVVVAGWMLFTVGPLHKVLAYRLQASAIDYSVSERMDLYRLGWRVFERNPVLGIGLNNFSVASNRLRGVDTVPHNLELGFLSELGVPGLVLVLGWVVSLLAAAWGAVGAARDGRERALALGLWAGFLGFAIHNQMESTLYGEQMKILLVLAAAATWRLAIRESGPSPLQIARSGGG